MCSETKATCLQSLSVSVALSILHVPVCLCPLFSVPACSTSFTKGWSHIWTKQLDSCLIFNRQSVDSYFAWQDLDRTPTAQQDYLNC